MSNAPRYIICVCDDVYARTLEGLRTHEVGSFTCSCGVVIGAWNGLLALRYAKVENADNHLRSTAHRIAGVAA